MFQMEVVVMRPIVIGTQYGTEALACAFMDYLQEFAFLARGVPAR